MRHIITTWFFATIVLVATVSVHAAAIQLPSTGQAKCYDATGVTGNETACAGTGQDGEKLAGVAWPSPRFADNGDGTVTDRLTGLIWLKNAKCTDTVNGILLSTGAQSWINALAWSGGLASGACGLSDGSAAGDWRLPNIVELRSLLDLTVPASASNPVLPSGHPFSNVWAGQYWTSTTNSASASTAWYVSVGTGSLSTAGKGNSSTNHVWPVRGGQ